MSEMPVFTLPGVENLLPSISIVVDEKLTTVYYQSEITRSNLTYAFSQDGSQPELFEITVQVGTDKNKALAELAAINFKDQETLVDLVRIGKDILRTENPSEDFASIKKDWGNYTISHASRNVTFAGITAQEMCLKKLRG